MERSFSGNHSRAEVLESRKLRDQGFGGQGIRTLRLGCRIYLCSVFRYGRIATKICMHHTSRARLRYGLFVDSDLCFASGTRGTAASPMWCTARRWSLSPRSLAKVLLHSDCVHGTRVDSTECLRTKASRDLPSSCKLPRIVYS